MQTENVKDPAPPSYSLTHKREDGERIHGEEKEGAVPEGLLLITRKGVASSSSGFLNMFDLYEGFALWFSEYF